MVVFLSSFAPKRKDKHSLVRKKIAAVALSNTWPAAKAEMFALQKKLEGMKA